MSSEGQKLMDERFVVGVFKFKLINLLIWRDSGFQEIHQKLRGRQKIAGAVEFVKLIVLRKENQAR